MLESTYVESSAPEATQPSPAILTRIATLQAAADPVRWTILDVLAAGTQCVCELREAVPVAANLLSYHLRVLRDAGLVTTRRRGRWIDYSLSADAHERLRAALPSLSGADR